MPKRLSRILFAALTAFLIGGTPVSHADPATSSPSPTIDFPSPAPLVELKDGDVFVFLGDSITHQTLYTQYIEDFFLTRYPERRITFHNAGVNGDRAADALRRFDRDVAFYQPDYVSVLLGMNDASYTAWKPEVFEIYVNDMTSLLDRLKETGAGITLMHPTMFDARAVRMRGQAGEPTASRYNGALAYYGEWCREMALERGLGFTDMHAPLNRITFEQRRKDPRFTMIVDGVHPGPDGQVVMAVAMLDETFVRGRLVSQLTLTSKADRKHELLAPGVEISEFSENAEGSIRFTCLAKSLPWVLPENARLGYTLTRAGHRHSGERFAAQGLKAGEWELAIDDVSIGQWSHSQLARGIELQENEKTPQYQLSLAVAKANAERNFRHVKKLRDWWGQKKGIEIELRKAALNNPGNPAEVAAMEQDYQAWIKTKFEPGIAEADAAAQASWEELRKMAQPKPHRYELRPAPK
ncbi:MAG: SGNH/GDSL hydrolase family protein [Verrucomicrobiae bacterium]|nr:SGNH/GDSL hydrolase family protein [Verrucomicrobiae bacterium]